MSGASRARAFEPASSSARAQRLVAPPPGDRSDRHGVGTPHHQPLRPRRGHRAGAGPLRRRRARPHPGEGALSERPLRVGLIASIAHRTPPRGYGPWEQMASTLAEGLTALGHDVTLFGTADSITSARLHAAAPRGYEEDPGVDAKVFGGLHIAAAFERAGEFDVLSNQFDFLPLTY